MVTWKVALQLHCAVQVICITTKTTDSTWILNRLYTRNENDKRTDRSSECAQCLNRTTGGQNSIILEYNTTLRTFPKILPLCFLRSFQCKSLQCLYIDSHRSTPLTSPFSCHTSPFTVLSYILFKSSNHCIHITAVFKHLGHDLRQRRGHNYKHTW
jgi:hypothetical protein